MNAWSTRLADLGYTLPDTATPLAAYVPAVRTGNLVYTSGQLSLVEGSLQQAGKVGDTVQPDEAASAARTCTLNALAAIDRLVGLNSIKRIVKVVGFVTSADGFTGQPTVINAASELLTDIFEEAGAHARSAVGVAELPLGAPVEVELIVEVR